MSSAIADLLDDHLRLLRSGEDTTEKLAATYGMVYPELPGLLRLARSLKHALVPVKPRPAFVAVMTASQRDRSDLAKPQPQSSGRPLALLLLAAVGSLLSLAGLLWFRGRRSGAPQSRPASSTC